MGLIRSGYTDLTPMNDGLCTAEAVLRDNRRTLEGCQKAGLEFILIDGEYDVDVQL